VHIVAVLTTIAHFSQGRQITWRTNATSSLQLSFV
jgi:hypothetical protein